MYIDDVDSFHVWLMDVLKKLCEAEPAALARYVIALVKKDKPEEQLRSVCLTQLDVFLQTSTPTFVEKLFDAIHSKSYISEVGTTNTDEDIKQPIKSEPEEQEEKTTTDATEAAKEAIKVEAEEPPAPNTAVPRRVEELERAGSNEKVRFSSSDSITSSVDRVSEVRPEGRDSISRILYHLLQLHSQLIDSG